MAYNPDDPYGIGDLYNGNFDVDPSFFQSEPVKMREQGAWNFANPVAPVAYVPPSVNTIGVTASSVASVPAPPPAPLLPTFRPMTTSNNNIKVAPSDIIQFDDSSIEIALISDLLFEDIGATELANISRSDLIDGQNVIYAPIKNLPTIRREFNPNNMIANSFFDDYFSRFGINLALRGVHKPYFNDDGDLVIQVDTVLSGEDIQVQVLSSGTIYMVDDI